jgi:hypothetical protein
MIEGSRPRCGVDGWPGNGYEAGPEDQLTCFYRNVGKDMCIGGVDFVVDVKYWMRGWAHQVVCPDEGVGRVILKGVSY